MSSFQMSKRNISFYERILNEWVAQIKNKGKAHIMNF